jgi:hypothetical protein
MQPDNENDAATPERPDRLGRDGELEDDRASDRRARAGLNSEAEAQQRPAVQVAPDPAGDAKRDRQAAARWRHAPPTD